MATATVQISRIARLLPLMMLALTTSLARADDTAKNTVRVGEYWIWYSVKAGDLTGPFVPPGIGLDVKNTHTPYFAYLRRLSTHFTVELAAGLPPLTKTVGKGPATFGPLPFNGQEIATARWFAPTLLMEYVFFDDSVPLRPYVGVGLNYVNFFDRHTTAYGNLISGGPTQIELPASYGFAGTAGLSYRLPHNLSVMVSYSAAQVNTRLTAITGNLVRTTHIEFNPTTVVFAVGYSF